MKPFRLVRFVGAILPVWLGIAVGTAQADTNPVVTRYVLRYAWFEAYPVRHSEIRDPVVELERPLSDSRTSAAVIAYTYPADRRISFQFAWDRPPAVLDLRRDAASGPYSVALQVQRGYGAQYRDENADIRVSSGGQAVDVGHSRVLEQLRWPKLLTETTADVESVGVSPEAGAQADSRRFWLGREPSATPERLASDLHYAYVRVNFQARGGYGTVFYVYEAVGASPAHEQTQSPAAGVVAIATDGQGSSAGGVSEGVDAPSDEPQLRIANSGFEAELAAPWGTGQYAQNRTLWWNSGGCESQAETDGQISHEGAQSLHIINRSPRSAHVFGTTQQPIAIEPGHRYRITLWARAADLASGGAVSVIVDSAWKIRPIQLPAGSFEWQEFQGEFTLPSSTADLRILSEDRGEVWLDDLQITRVD